MSLLGCGQLVLIESENLPLRHDSIEPRHVGYLPYASHVTKRSLPVPPLGKHEPCNGNDSTTALSAIAVQVYSLVAEAE